MSKQNEEVETKETGGIVTTVKEEESKDVDFQRRLKELRGEDGEADEDDKPKEKPAVKSKIDDDDDDDADGDWQKTLSPTQRREVNRLYKDRKRMEKDHRTTQSQLDRLSAELAELKNGRVAAPAAQTNTGALQRPAKPNPLDPKYKNEEEFKAAEEKYEDDLYAYRKQQEQTKEAEKKANENARQAIARFNTQVDELVVEFEDYEEIMDAADNEVSDLMFGAIMEEGPRLGMYFAQHPKVSSRIARMADEKEATKEIMRIVIRIEDDVEAAKKKKAEAAGKEKDAGTKDKKPETPIKTVNGKQTTTVIARDKSKMSFKERERLYAKEHPGALNYEP